VGKTTVATGIMAAIARSGTAVASAKVGPDFIDPGYHSLATGRPGRNLDAWICGDEAMAPLAARAAEGADLLVVEGVMGLFDGVSDPAALEFQKPIEQTLPESTGISSTASVAIAIDAPVVLVIDASAMSGSVAALVHGFDTFSPRIALSGVILNRVGSDAHLRALERALEEVDVALLGTLRRDESLRWRDRHLGLVPVVEHAHEVRRSLSGLADAISAGVDLDAIERIARSAPVSLPGPLEVGTIQGRARIAVASGPAFSFMYQDNIERLQQAGAEIVPFDPMSDARVPDGVQGLVAGGGFPETFAEALAANLPMIADVRSKVSKGMVTWAECGGLLWLANSLDGHRLCGAIDADASMSSRLTLGYRRALARAGNPVIAEGEQARGHEFHYSTIDPVGDGLDLAGREGRARGGYCAPDLFASYLHLHLGANPSPAERFVARAAGASAPEATGSGAKWDGKDPSVVSPRA
jgi:cobyrinic acid a,c-diamide synthase